jgi:hypothetical protein
VGSNQKKEKKNEKSRGKNQKKNDHRCIAAPVKIGTQNVSGEY